MYKIVMESGGGTCRDFMGGFLTEYEAVQFARNYDWRFVDDNCFEWSLYVDEDCCELYEDIADEEVD